MYADSFPVASLNFSAPFSVSAWPACDLVDKGRSTCGWLEILIFVSIRVNSPLIFCNFLPREGVGGMRH
jgi:hypothetical protein